MPWTPANSDHIDLLKTAFAVHGPQRKLTHVSYLAHPGIADFHAHRLIETVQEGSNDSLRLFINDGRIEAIAGIAPSPWHSEHFGVPNLKIQPFFCFTDEGDSVREIVRNLLNFLDQPSSVYAIRIEAQQHGMAYEMALAGFAPVGTSVRMVSDDRRQAFDSEPKTQYDTVIIRDFQGSDLPALQDIIRRSHKHSHFFNEPRFGRGRVSDLFAEWIRKCSAGIAKKILVAETDGRVAGFCSLLSNNALISYIGTGIGIIDFIAVDEQIQGKGLGRLLLDAGCSCFGPETGFIELRTMADNLQAIRFYEKNGFRMLSADQYFHYWS